MDHIIPDKSGKLVSGIFFEFVVHAEDALYGERVQPTWIISRRHPTDDELLLRGDDDEWISADIEGRECQTLLDCPVDKTHVTAEYWTKLRVDTKGTRISEFVPDVSEVGGAAFVSDPFARRLKAIGLSGFELEPIRVRQVRPPGEPPKLHVLHFKGQACERPSVVRGAPNACPFCGREPLICQVCGYSSISCPKCGESCWTSRGQHQGAADRRLIVCPPEQRETRILEGSRWDGSDFVYGTPSMGAYGHFITKRALDWLLSVHAAPFYVKPALVNVERLTDEQRDRLEAVAKPR